MSGNPKNPAKLRVFEHPYVQQMRETPPVPVDVQDMIAQTKHATALLREVLKGPVNGHRVHRVQGRSAS